MQRHRDENNYSEAMLQQYQQGGFSVLQSQFSQNQQIVNSEQKNNSKSRFLGAPPIPDIPNIQGHVLSMRTPQAQFDQRKSLQQAQMDFSKSRMDVENLHRNSNQNHQMPVNVFQQSCSKNQFEQDQGQIKIAIKEKDYKQIQKIQIGKSKVEENVSIEMNIVKDRILILSPVVQDCLESEQSRDDFDFIETLYEGPFSQVFKCQHLITKKLFAIKRISKYMIQINKNRQYVINEARMLYQLNHPYIIKLLNHFEEDEYVYLVFQFYKNGTLANFINQFDKQYPNRLATKFVRQIAIALDYLHGLNIIHRDLKPENMLINDNQDILISDFGLSTYYDGRPRKSYCGTTFYMAPEILSITNGYNQNVDIWSLGITTYYLLTDKPYYWPNKDFDETFIISLYEGDKYRKILQSNLPSQLIYSARELLLKMLEKDPNQRPKPREIINNFWIIFYQIFKDKNDDYVDNQTQKLELLSYQKTIIYSSSQISTFLGKN